MFTRASRALPTLLALVACHGRDDASADSKDHPDSPADTAVAPAPVVAFPGQPPANLLVISVDTVQRAQLDRYSGNTSTPFLDGMLEDAVVMDDLHACSSWTLPGISCSLAGVRPEEVGVLPHIASDGVTGDLPEGTPTLAGELATAGFQTSLVAANVYFSSPAIAAGYDTSLVEGGQFANWVTDQAIPAAEALAGADRWMLHVHYLDPHLPYHPPEQYLGDLEGRAALDYDLSTTAGMHELANDWSTLDEATQAEVRAQLLIRYRGELRYVDDEVARLWDALGASGMLDDTLVLFWTDHGEQIFEHGTCGHAGSLYAEENDAFAAWWAPGLAPVAWAGPTTQEDIVPTTLLALGVPVPESMSGTPAGLASEDRPRFAALWQSGAAPAQAVQVGEKELIYEWEGRKQFFRRGHDPAQEENVYTPTDPDVIALWELLTPEIERIQAIATDETPVNPGP